MSIEAERRFLFRLGGTLGMTPLEVMSKMPTREVSEWMAYFETVIR